MSDDLGKIPPFAMVDELDNHLYAKTVNISTNPDFNKTVSRHLDMIRDAVPPNIYFRSSSSRLDLHRFLIIGSPGTVYYNSYFLFDMILPNEYPRVPPQVKMHAFDHRCNPNLYSCGKVCLSLLGTWDGQGAEVWSPENSNLLQVAIGIQGLVLGVEEPYYNEPGLVKTMKDSPQSVSYNNTAFIVSLIISTKLLKSPPREFAPILRAHFEKNCLETLMILDFLMAGPKDRGEEEVKRTGILEKYRMFKIPKDQWPRLKGIRDDIELLRKSFIPSSC